MWIFPKSFYTPCVSHPVINLNTFWISSMWNSFHDFANSPKLRNVCRFQRPATMMVNSWTSSTATPLISYSSNTSTKFYRENYRVKTQFSHNCRNPWKSHVHVSSPTACRDRPRCLSFNHSIILVWRLQNGESENQPPVPGTPLCVLFFPKRGSVIGGMQTGSLSVLKYCSLTHDYQIHRNQFHRNKKTALLRQKNTVEYFMLFLDLALHKKEKKRRMERKNSQLQNSWRKKWWRPAQARKILNKW